MYRCIDVIEVGVASFFASFQVSEVGEKLKKCVCVREREGDANSEFLYRSHTFAMFYKGCGWWDL